MAPHGDSSFRKDAEHSACNRGSIDAVMTLHNNVNIPRLGYGTAGEEEDKDENRGICNKQACMLKAFFLEVFPATLFNALQAKQTPCMCMLVKINS